LSLPPTVLREFRPRHKFLVAIDSDGCVFDNMELKHNECFIPRTISHWDLGNLSKHARAAAEFVNLYSHWRGLNRFPALIKTVDLLARWPEAMAGSPPLPDLEALRRWVARETRLGNPALQEEIARNPHPVLIRALAWSRDVNEVVARTVRWLPPIPNVRESLEALSRFADVIVSSSTSGELLLRDWGDRSLARYVRVIAGQEMGPKEEHIARASRDRYEPQRVMMIGDSPGDRKAALANHALFYPIRPGREAASWAEFLEEGVHRFRRGTFGGYFQASLSRRFEAELPREPPWARPRTAERSP